MVEQQQQQQEQQGRRERRILLRRRQQQQQQQQQQRSNPNRRLRRRCFKFSLVVLFLFVAFLNLRLIRIVWTTLEDENYDNLHGTTVRPMIEPIIRQSSTIRFHYQHHNKENKTDIVSPDRGASSASYHHHHQEQEKDPDIRTSAKPRIAYITYSYLGALDRWEEIILPATELFVPSDQPYFVVLNTRWKSLFEQLLFLQTHNNINRVDFNNKNTTTANLEVWSRYGHRIHPIFVDNCPEGVFGESPCCKMQEGLLQFYESGLHHSYDFILYMDDDMFIRHDALSMYLQSVWEDHIHHHDDNDDDDDGFASLILTSDAPTGHILGQAGYLSYRSPYKCSYRFPWGQPVIYTRQSFERVVTHVFRRGGLMEQCRAFNVTHDSGNAIIHWMLEFQSLWIRTKEFMSPNRKDVIGVHRIGRHGSLLSKLSRVHKIYRNPLLAYPVAAARERKWTNTTGQFRNTSVYQQYGPVEDWTEWHTMAVSDCLASPAP